MQFNYLETILGRKLDIFNDYHVPGSIPMNTAETTFAYRANTYDYSNYKPADNWAAANDDNAAVNANIKQVVDNIKVNGHKVFIIIWHEPQNDPTAAEWNQWLNGGASPLGNQGSTAVGHQTLVNTIRSLGANNTFLQMERIMLST